MSENSQTGNTVYAPFPWVRWRFSPPRWLSCEITTGECVCKGIVTNNEKIKFTGKKFKNKVYYRHTGHPGGIKENTPLRLADKDQIDEILKLAVKRMLPGGPLAKKQLSKLKIYKGDKHPHEVQNPTIIKFNELNKKNTVSI